MQAILLIPENGAHFHLGETSLDDTSDILHSDTLFSALANVYEMALSGAGTLIALMDKGKLRFSSGLYALKYNGTSLLFIPKPPVDFSGNKKDKKLKQIRYISLGVWKKFIVSFNQKDLSSTLDLLAFPSIGGEFIYTEEELAGVTDKLDSSHFRHYQTVPKVKIHTTDQEDCLYHETTVQFVPIKCGIKSITGAYFFFAEYNLLTVAEQTEFMAALRIMADEGVGGQRSSGRGQFASVELLESDSIDLPSIQAPSHYLGLSLISPVDNSEFHEGLLDYELILRGGGSLGTSGAAELHRRQARFVREGALLQQKITGQFVDVSPEQNRTILRNGFNFALPIGIHQ